MTQTTTILVPPLMEKTPTTWIRHLMTMEKISTRMMIQDSSLLLRGVAAVDLLLRSKDFVAMAAAHDFGSRCTGYEYDSVQRNCEVWRANIDPSQTRRANVRGLDCYIKEEKKNDDQCFRNSSPRVNRNGQRFQFKLENSRDSKCVDRHRQFYEYGQFQGVDSFDSCARTCVNNVNSSLLRHFQGIDFNCEAKACNCLYDSGTLNNRNSRRFDRTVTRFNGVGRVRNTRFAEGFACGSVNLIVNRRGPPRRSKVEEDNVLDMC